MECCPLPDSSRRKMSWIFCRKSASRPEPRSAQEPPGLTPFSRLFRFSASVDHQMTPALFAGAFRASRFRPAHWRTGCRARLRRPSDLKHRTAPDCGEGKAVFGLNCALHLRSVGRRALLVPLASRITRLAVKGAGWGRALGNAHCVPGVSFEPGGLGLGLLAAEVGRVGRGVLPPWNVELRPTAPGARFLKNLSVFRRQTRASFRSRAARAFALLAALSLLCVS